MGDARGRAPPYGARMQILVVDDDEAMRTLLALHLSNAGYRVRGVEDGIQAGYAILRQAPDLLIVDVDMPHLSGIELVSALRADPSVPPVRVLFISAHEQFAEQAMALGDGFLLKPFTRDRLLEVVAQAAGDAARSG